MGVVVDVRSGVEGTVTAVLRAVGDEVTPTAAIAVAELMKLEQPIVARDHGVLVDLLVEVGDEVDAGSVVARIDTSATTEDDDVDAPGPTRRTSSAGRSSQPRPEDDGWTDGDRSGSVGDAAAADERPDVAALRRRLALTRDDARPEVVTARHADGSRTARENLADLLDEDSFTEYGALAHAAQRRRRDPLELRRRTPADGIVTGLGTIAAADLAADGGTARDATVAVAAYDYTVLAGTQGHTSHAKLDRLLGVAHRLSLPFVLYAEGGGGRPGDTDAPQGAWLGVPTFRLLAALAGATPTVAVCHGLSFAGNAALAGLCDVVVATEDAVVGMAGPAMVAGGGLGEFEPGELGPVTGHARVGAVDLVVPDEAAATVVARDLVRLLRGDRVAPRVDEQREHDVGDLLRHLVPLDQKRAHDAGALLRLVADPGSLVELRTASAPGIRTAVGRVHGVPVGFLANDPRHLAGAIDSRSAESAAQHLGLCDAHGLPVVSLVDTPGFMVGPASDAEGAFRRTGRLYRAGARLRPPLVAIVIRRAFGLGAMAMTGGDLRAPLATFAWPAAELGPMGLEGAVRLGARRELAAIEDGDAREARVAELLGEARAHASALNVATFAEVDEVIDPADTRDRIAAVLAAAGHGPREGRPRPARHD